MFSLVSFDDKINSCFEDNKFTIDLHPNSGTKTFHSLDEIEKHVKKEIEFWSNLDGEIANVYKGIKSEINGIQELKESIDSDGKKDRNQVDKVVDKLKNKFNETKDWGKYCIYSESRQAKFLKEFADNNKDRYDIEAVIEFLLNDADLKPENRVQFFGFLDIYMHFYASDISKKLIKNQNKNLQNLYKKFISKSNECNNKLSDINSLKTKSEQAFITMQENVQSVADEAFQSQQENLKDKFDKDHQEWTNKVSALEKAYTAHLSLAAPLECWKSMIEKKRKHGFRFAVLSIIMTILMAACIFTVLYDAHFIEIFNATAPSKLIRGSLLLLALTSIWGYLLHLVVKFSISSYHLASDYEERKQLTHVYLSMIKDGSIDDNPELKNMIMQSVFSRAETGLLKGEHAPTMPMANLIELANKH